MPSRWAGACRAVMNTCDDGAKRNVFARLSEPYTTAAAFAVRRNTHFYAMAIASQSACARLRWRDWKPTDMRTPTLPRLSASRDACLEGGREPRGARIAGGFRCQGRRADVERSCVAEIEVVSIPKARRSGHKHRSQAHLLCARLAVRPHPSVVVCRTAVVLSIGKRYHTSTPAQPGIAADRCAREIEAILKSSCIALAAAECQPVGSWPGSVVPVTLHNIGNHSLWSFVPMLYRVMNRRS